ncbi:hypothetical protein [Pseudarthrobacter sp. S9]|uniref:hypothetical protein n=1 Tax=Pseudarthrobacter sp. S9 TaxID=3418421 RepID=UPI003CFE2A77
MTHKPSKAQQQTAIGEGLAIGCLALGAESVTSAKVEIEFAFRKAWRNWPHAGKFPAVHADVYRDDITRILHDSKGRTDASAAAWEFGGSEYVPFIRQDWPFEELADSAGEDFGVNLDGWKELAKAFMDDLNSEH